MKPLTILDNRNGVSEEAALLSTTSFYFACIKYLKAAGKLMSVSKLNDNYVLACLPVDHAEQSHYLYLKNDDHH